MKSNTLVFLGFALICLVNMRHGHQENKAAKPTSSVVKAASVSKTKSTKANHEVLSKVTDRHSEASNEKDGAADRPL